MRRYLCNVPHDKCFGAETILPKGLGKKLKVHATREQAFKCYCNYLIDQGYTKVGSREFTKEGEAILVLNKKSKFGAECRLGKNVDNSANRFVPKYKGKRSGAGIII